MISRSNRYERWDGSQEPFGRDAEDLFDRLAEDLFQGGDFDYALHRLMTRGWRDKQGRRLPGFEEMLERLRQKRLQQLKRYNLNDVFSNIGERLRDIVRRERRGSNRTLGTAPGPRRSPHPATRAQIRRRRIHSTSCSPTSWREKSRSPSSSCSASAISS